MDGNKNDGQLNLKNIILKDQVCLSLYDKTWWPKKARILLFRIMQQWIKKDRNYYLSISIKCFTETCPNISQFKIVAVQIAAETVTKNLQRTILECRDEK